MSYLGNNPKFITQTYRPQSADPSNPVEGMVFRSDGTPRAVGLHQYISGAWQPIADSGTSNYILNPKAEIDTNGWATYADAAGVAPVNGTGGSPNITWTRITSSTLQGAGSFRLTKDAANRQGQGASYDFSIATADAGNPLVINLNHRGSANYAAGDVRCYVYDVTNATLITPSRVTIAVDLNSGRFSTSFNSVSTSTSYRLIFHIASTSALSYTLDFDNITISPTNLFNSQIVARYTTTSQSFSSSTTPTRINFDSSSIDTNNAVTTGASWAFTCPTAGDYVVMSQITWANTDVWANGELGELLVYKNGARFSGIVWEAIATSGQGFYLPWSIRTVVPCGKGDTIDVRAYQNSGSTLALVATSDYCEVNIYKI